MLLAIRRPHLHLIPFTTNHKSCNVLLPACLNHDEMHPSCHFKRREKCLMQTKIVIVEERKDRNLARRGRKKKDEEIGSGREDKKVI